MEIEVPLKKCWEKNIATWSKLLPTLFFKVLRWNSSNRDLCSFAWCKKLQSTQSNTQTGFLLPSKRASGWLCSWANWDTLCEFM